MTLNPVVVQHSHTHVDTLLVSEIVSLESEMESMSLQSHSPSGDSGVDWESKSTKSSGVKCTDDAALICCGRRRAAAATDIPEVGHRLGLSRDSGHSETHSATFTVPRKRKPHHFLRETR